MKISGKEVAVPSVTLFIICLIITGLLAGTNLLTKDIIAAQKAANEEASRKVVLAAAESFEESTLAEQNGETKYFIGKDASGNDVGCVFTTKAKGYGGDVEVMTGIGADGMVGGVVILSQNETPGLGANAEKETFRDQYKKAAPDNGFSVVKSGSAGDGQISALTGATITSAAVTDAVNEAIRLYHEVKGVE